MFLGPVFGHLQALAPDCQVAHCGEQGVACNHGVALRSGQCLLRVENVLLRNENVESRALADLAFFDNAFEREIGGGDLRPAGPDSGECGLELRMGRNHGLLHRGPRRVDEDSLLPQDFLRLANLAVFRTALIDRNFEPSRDAGRRVIKPLTGITVLRLTAPWRTTPGSIVPSADFTW